MTATTKQRRMIRKARARASAPEKVDLAIAEFFLPYRETAPAKLLAEIGSLGDQPPLYAAAGAVTSTGLILGDWKLARAGARMLAVHVAAITIKNIMKRLVDRTRPNLIEDQNYEMCQGERTAHDYTSFPSGHTASSVAVACALARDYPAAAPAALAGAATVGAAQVGACRHYASDVVAGAAIGVLADAAVDLIFRRFPARED